MANFSFDIVSEFDKSELNNAFEQTRRELSNRYDLKGTSADIEWLDNEKSALKITGDNDFHLQSILDIFRKKLASRAFSQKIIDDSSQAISANLKITQEIRFKSGIKPDDAKKISRLIRDNYPKVKAQIQGEEVRVTSGKKDELQAVMKLVGSQDFDFPVNFVNFR